MWTAELEGTVHDIGVVQGESFLLAAGHGPANLTSFGREGDCLWSKRIEREPCPWPWWELPTPVAVQVAGGVWEGEPFFAVGCGDIQVRCFDERGDEQWRWRYNEGVPGRVTVADVDGSGKPRVVVGGDILSDQSTCRILEPASRASRTRHSPPISRCWTATRTCRRSPGTRPIRMVSSTAGTRAGRGNPRLSGNR